MKLELRYCQKLAYSPAFVDVMEAYVELMRAGMAPHRIDIYNRNQIVYAVDGDRPQRDDGSPLILGASVFSTTEEAEGHVNFSFVHKDYRRRGVHRAIIGDVEARLRKLGCAIMISGIHHQNHAMLGAAASAARLPTVVRHVKDLKV